MTERQDSQGQMFEDIHSAPSWKAMLDTESELAPIRRDVLRKSREWSPGLKGQRPCCSRQVMSDEIVPGLRPLVGHLRR